MYVDWLTWIILYLLPEALLRYHSQKRGQVYPDEFIPLLEQPMKIFMKSGIFEELGEEAFCANIDDALAESEELIKNR